MTTAGLNLLVPEKRDPERDSVAETFARCGGAVHRLERFWDPNKRFDVAKPYRTRFIIA
jgi:hypothetical protein